MKKAVEPFGFTAFLLEQLDRGCRKESSNAGIAAAPQENTTN